DRPICGLGYSTAAVPCSLDRFMGNESRCADGLYVLWNSVPGASSRIAREGSTATISEPCFREPRRIAAGACADVEGERALRGDSASKAWTSGNASAS